MPKSLKIAKNTLTTAKIQKPQGTLTILGKGQKTIPYGNIKNCSGT